MNKRTADHYSRQWSNAEGFGAFVEANPTAASVMPGRQLPWDALMSELRQVAETKSVRVYDAACGFGDIMRRLMVAPLPSGLSYLGADIHSELGSIVRPPRSELIEHDITSPTTQIFDAILCRAAIHHTPDPAVTYRVLASQLAPGGVLAISTYAKKTPMREAIDDALRAKIVPMSNDEAMIAAGQFTALGKMLQACEGEIEISADLPLLEIKAGRYKIQDFIYRHFMKCWNNAAFSDAHATLINFDWYHPPFAFRYTMAELEDWAHLAGLTIQRQASTEAQHYLEARNLNPAGEVSRIALAGALFFAFKSNLKPAPLGGQASVGGNGESAWFWGNFDLRNVAAEAMGKIRETHRVMRKHSPTDDIFLIDLVAETLLTAFRHQANNNAINGPVQDAVLRGSFLLQRVADFVISEIGKSHMIVPRHGS